jgi:hypothetical protein
VSDEPHSDACAFLFGFPFRTCLRAALACPCASVGVTNAAPAPFPRPLLPDPGPLEPGTAFAGQPGVWLVNWMRKSVGPDGRKRWSYRDFEVTLGRDRSWRAGPVNGGKTIWRGRWSWDEKRRTLTVKETRDGRRWHQWTLTLAPGVTHGLVKGDFGEARASWRPKLPDNGQTVEW